jgi:hypothetical protein
MLVLYKSRSRAAARDDFAPPPPLRNHNERINERAYNEKGREDYENAIPDDLETPNFQNLAPLSVSSFLFT